MKSQKQYGLSIDADVALWMESRMTEGKPMLDGMGGFVFINSELHDNFIILRVNTAVRDTAHFHTYLF